MWVLARDGTLSLQSLTGSRSVQPAVRHTDPTSYYIPGYLVYSLNLHEKKQQYPKMIQRVRVWADPGTTTLSRESEAGLKTLL